MQTLSATEIERRRKAVRLQTTMNTPGSSPWELVEFDHVAEELPGFLKDVSLKGLVGRLHRPPDGGPYPGVVVLGGSGGGLNWSAEVAMELAKEGYAALAVAYFGLPGLQKNLVNIELDCFQAVFEWLRHQPGVNDTRLGLVGASRGAELALQLGTTFSTIAQVVCYAPSSVRWGPVGGLATFGQPAWRWRGEPLPQMPRPRLHRLAVEAPKLACSRMMKTPYFETRLFQTLLGDERAVREATICVERIGGPVLLISGSDDQLWPSARMSEMICDRLTSNNYPFAFTHLKCEGAGHAIGLPNLPLDCYPTRMRHGVTGITYALGGTSEANAAAANAAWATVLKFLDRHNAAS